MYVTQWVGIFAAMAIWMIVLGQLDAVLTNNFIAIMPLAFIMFVLSSQVQYHASLYRSISSIMTILLTYGAMLDQQTMAPVFTIAAGIFLTISGIKYRQKIPFFAGNICVAGGFLFYWEYAINLYATVPWASSIALGLVVILLASYIENKEKQIMAKSRYYFNELKSWN